MYKIADALFPNKIIRKAHKFSKVLSDKRRKKRISHQKQWHSLGCLQKNDRLADENKRKNTKH
jgi:hypothetical protein